MTGIMKKNPQIILASNSPRRKKILEDAGYKIKVHPSNIDETSLEKEPHIFTKNLSLKKAEEVFSKFPKSIIIAADTIVYMEGNIYGKPQNINEAINMLKSFSNKTHSVVTGVTILHSRKSIMLSDEALITFKNLLDNEIVDYLKSSNPYDKAGSYSVEDLPKDFIKEINGETTTILGLPIPLLKEKLDRLIKEVSSY